MGVKKDFLLNIVLFFILITIMLSAMLFIREGNILKSLSFSLHFSLVWGAVVVFAYLIFPDIGGR